MDVATGSVRHIERGYMLSRGMNVTYSASHVDDHTGHTNFHHVILGVYGYVSPLTTTEVP